MTPPDSMRPHRCGDPHPSVCDAGESSTRSRGGASEYGGMRTFGLVGYPLGHSFSANWFADRFAAERITNAQYLDFPLENIGMLPRLLAGNDNLSGFNVTIPYKESILPYLDTLSPDAAAIGAVNCVVRKSDPDCKTGRSFRFEGHNTDWEGFRRSLEGFLGGERPDALILGTGGSAKAVAYALGHMGIRCDMVSRGGEKKGPKKNGNRPGNTESAELNNSDESVTEQEAKSGGNSTSPIRILTYGELGEAEMSAHSLIINTTPLGMYPDTGSSPALPYRLLTSRHMLFDLVYNPSATAFLREGEARGCRTKNGLEMLHLQAELSWELFRTAR